MIFVLQDDNCIHPYASPEDAARAIEPIDAEEVIRAAFDDVGCRLSLCWIEQPKREGLWVGGGRYELLPSSAPDIPGFREFVASASEAPAEVQSVLSRLLGRATTD